jgi:hypothetical protein
MHRIPVLLKPGGQRVVSICLPASQPSGFIPECDLQQSLLDRYIKSVEIKYYFYRSHALDDEEYATDILLRDLRNLQSA